MIDLRLKVCLYCLRTRVTNTFLLGQVWNILLSDCSVLNIAHFWPARNQGFLTVSIGGEGVNVLSNTARVSLADYLQHCNILSFCCADFTNVCQRAYFQHSFLRLIIHFFVHYPWFVSCDWIMSVHICQVILLLSIFQFDERLNCFQQLILFKIIQNVYCGTNGVFPDQSRSWTSFV